MTRTSRARSFNAVADAKPVLAEHDERMPVRGQVEVDALREPVDERDERWRSGVARSQHDDLDWRRALDEDAAEVEVLRQHRAAESSGRLDDCDVRRPTKPRFDDGEDVGAGRAQVLDERPRDVLVREEANDLHHPELDPVSGLHDSRSVEDRRVEIGARELRIFAKDLVALDTVRDEREDEMDGHARTADHRLAGEDRRIHDDALVRVHPAIDGRSFHLIPFRGTTAIAPQRPLRAKRVT
ncbi:MAG: hypothetical protein ACYDCK_15595 [Thermoplasmatota archaeon]